MALRWDSLVNQTKYKFESPIECLLESGTHLWQYSTFPYHIMPSLYYIYGVGLVAILHHV